MVESVRNEERKVFEKEKQKIACSFFFSLFLLTVDV